MKFPLPKLPWGRLVLPGLACFLFLFHLTGIVDFHESDALDLRFRLRGKQEASRSIVIVTIDDASLTSFGQWPWPHGVYAGFLERVSRYSPRAVIFDILFPEKSLDPAQDAKFAEALKKTSNVYLPFFYTQEKPLAASFPVSELREAVRTQSCYVNAPPDADGKVRRLKGFLESENFYPALSLCGLSKEEILTRVRFSSKNDLWINFPGGLESFQTVSFYEFIQAAAAGQEEKLTNLFSGKFVFLGHTATGTTDLRVTPFSGQTPGVAVHGSALHTVLTGKFLKPLPEVLHLFLLLLLTVSTGFGFKTQAPARGFLILLGLLAGYFALNFILFLFTGWILPLFVPMAAMVLSYALTLFGKYTEIRIQREMTERELATASRIQEQFLPQETPESTAFEAAFQCKFIKQVGGDLYDWTDLGGGKTGFGAGDVSGKGMPAAIYMAKAISDFRSLAKENKTAGAVCTEFNDRLLLRPTPGMFPTFFYAVVDPAKKQFQYSSAGHEPGFFWRARNSKADL